MLKHCRVVLVQPRIAGNIGATARIMHNMGLTELVLVAPEVDLSDPRARQQSTQGEEILDRAHVVDDFGDAVADCVLVAGTAARTGGLFRRQSLGTPEEIMPHLAKVLAADHPAALVFGPEPRGLTNADVTKCHYLIHIPTEPEYPALNLSHAVAICLYELRLAWQKNDLSSPQRELLATFAAQEHMFAQLRTALEEIHFLYGPKADSLMHALRHLLGRANMTEMEVDVLLGLARQIGWYVHQDRGKIQRKGSSMSKVTIQEAQAKLPDLIHQLMPGEELVITENDLPVAKLVAQAAEKPRPMAGRCKGMLTILAEDDEHLQDFKEYMP